MDIKQIQELIKFVSRSGVNEVAIEQVDFKITIKTNQTPTVITTTVPAQPAAPAPVLPAAAAAQPAAVENKPEVKLEDNSKYVTIKSPMIGTFYRSSSPDKPSFVNVGDEFQAGKVICIIEAMKLFNEIESEISGRIVKVLVDNASPVEYDQPLFLVEPM
ncbi:acetyl-CoA carboxylase biotin carboxyl carrier protein [Pedobacter sp.]|uniref:acetyl-CoA carboxylase biotin carboxyl carrier protein n=1 Tax=Pedobacter sp. TaxID=1411316 RepID=UPI003D7F370F